MKVTTRRMTAYTLITDDEREFSLPIGNGDYMPDDALVTDLPDGRTVVSYLVPDWDGGTDNPLERDDDAVEWIEFRNGDERNEWIDANLHGCEYCGNWPDDHDEEGHCGYPWTPTEYRKAFDNGHLFPVERYEHSMVRYALTNESSQVDRQWDVAPCVAFLRLDDQWGPTVDLKEMARSILQEYTDWCNGNIFGIVHVFYDAGGEPDEERDYESCWGYIGDEYATQTMTEEHAMWVTAETRENA